MAGAATVSRRLKRGRPRCFRSVQLLWVLVTKLRLGTKRNVADRSADQNVGRQESVILGDVLIGGAISDIGCSHSGHHEPVEVGGFIERGVAFEALGGPVEPGGFGQAVGAELLDGTALLEVQEGAVRAQAARDG